MYIKIIQMADWKRFCVAYAYRIITMYYIRMEFHRPGKWKKPGRNSTRNIKLKL